MKLISFSVTNYRSITTAHKIPLSNLTVLVGKNNEGKSNLLMALNIAMLAILLESKISDRSVRSPYKYKNINYDWSRDFPIQLQSRKSGLESIFTLYFRLEGNELDDFHSNLGIRGNEDIPIRIRFKKDNTHAIEVPKKGTSSYNKKASKIADFISCRISFNYIQAIRTDKMAMTSLLGVIREELSSIVNKEDYKSAIKIITDLQKSALDKIAQTLIDPLKIFLPNIKSVKINNSNEEFFERPYFYHPYYDDINIIIDDGIPTSISFKGDGVKSLATLAILKDRQQTKAASIIAIEEPESHLHSGAIHSLVDVINNLAQKNQVIITTHNPLFVQQNNLKANIIVNDGKAYQAKNIAEIRKILGVLVSDNLKNANKVLVVEGEDDLISLNKILSLKSEKIAVALKNNLFIIKPLYGVANLSHDLLDLKTNICKYVVLVDHDNAGKAAAEKAINDGLLTLAELRYAICNGSPESEFEDCIKSSVYSSMISNKYGVNLNTADFHSNKKWSDRVKACFLRQGATWNDKIEREIKYLVAESISGNSLSDILISEKSGFIDGLVQLIENMIDEI